MQKLLRSIKINLTQEICNVLDVIPEAIGITKYGSRQSYSYEKVIEAFLPNNSTKEVAEFLSVKHQTLEKYLLNNWVFKQPRFSKENWCTYFLRLINLKFCAKCGVIHPEDNFFLSEERVRGVQPFCKNCEEKKSVLYYNKNTEKILMNSKEYYYSNSAKIAKTHKIYFEEHKGEFNARTAKRRASKLLRTPTWSNLERIKEFYKNCPAGCHVDHIVPLQGELVSGLHVENNLQYLAVYDNLSKGNSFKV